MKIKTVNKSYEEVMSLPKAGHRAPVKPNIFMRSLMRAAAIPDLMQVKFAYTQENMDKAGSGPWLILMNHSSFLDLEIASKMLYPRPYNIICTSDGFVGKENLMRGLGCVPTQKFVTDLTLISDIAYALKTNKTSVLMYPEASYSFDGTATPLPRKMGILFKRMRVPVVMISTFGSFARDPLYNNLQKRKVEVSAKMECLLTPEEIKSMSVDEIDDRLDKTFSFDYFDWQKKNDVHIPETFRADGLDRILYRCMNCGAEGRTEGKGTRFVCRECRKEYELSELGELNAISGETEYTHIPDWYAAERALVKEEIERGTYSLDTDVEIGLMVDYNSIYMVGEGKLHHDRNGFVLDGCSGKLHYEQGPSACYSLYADYFWYEIGDIICIGNKDCLYYCFPKKDGVVAKTRLAVEEIYKAANRRS